MVGQVGLQDMFLRPHWDLHGTVGSTLDHEARQGLGVHFLWIVDKAVLGNEWVRQEGVRAELQFQRLGKAEEAGNEGEGKCQGFENRTWRESESGPGSQGRTAVQEGRGDSFGACVRTGKEWPGSHCACHPCCALSEGQGMQ